MFVDFPSGFSIIICRWISSCRKDARIWPRSKTKRIAILCSQPSALRSISMTPLSQVGEFDRIKKFTCRIIAPDYCHFCRHSRPAYLHIYSSKICVNSAKGCAAALCLHNWLPAISTPPLLDLVPSPLLRLQPIICWHSVEDCKWRVPQRASELLTGVSCVFCVLCPECPVPVPFASATCHAPHYYHPRPIDSGPCYVSSSIANCPWRIHDWLGTFTAKLKLQSLCSALFSGCHHQGGIPAEAHLVLSTLAASLLSAQAEYAVLRQGWKGAFQLTLVFYSIVNAN